MSKAGTIAKLLGGTAALTASDNADAGVITKAGKKIIEAWHGSPHSFDAFDISKIGTGEGAQVYGHGLYFADSPAVAKGYRQELTGRDAQKSFQSALPDDAEFSDVEDMLGTGAFTPQQERVIKALQADDWLGFDYPAQAINAAYRDNISNFDASPELVSALKGEGALYRAHIDVNPDNLLDWDKPLSEQSEAVKNAFYSMARSPEGVALAKQYHSYQDGMTLDQLPEFANPYGETIYKVAFSGDAPNTSQRLRDQGIPGIRYLDGMSRDGGEGTYNYVMFDHKPISIVERGNAAPSLLAGTAAATGAGMAVNQASQDVADLNSAHADYTQRRASKRDFWQSRRQDVLDLARSVGGFADSVALPALDKPLQGYLGIAGTLGTLAHGGGIDEAIRQGAAIASQPSDATTYNMGGAVTDALSPYVPGPVAAGAGALTNAGIQLSSPF